MRSRLDGEAPRIGVALGGGFARGIAHVGALRVFERGGIAIHSIAGVSAGSIVAAAFASGAAAEEIGRAGASMKFADVARWRPGRMGLLRSECMERFLKGLLKCRRFEEMTIPLGVVATDLMTGQPVEFRDSGDVCLPIRASCSYPGLFQPVDDGGRLLVDGAMSVEVPAALVRALGATHVVAVDLPMPPAVRPRNAFQVVNRCFQILQSRAGQSWERLADVVISPEMQGVRWDAFHNAAYLVEAGERAAEEALPAIRALAKSRTSDELIPG